MDDATIKTFAYVLTVALLIALSFALESIEKALEARGYMLAAKIVGVIRAQIPDGPEAKRRALKLLPLVLFATAVSACALTPLQVAVQASNVALEVGRSAGEELELQCTRPMVSLAAKRAVATDEAEKKRVTEAALKLHETCEPHVAAHAGLRRAHKALVVVLLHGLAGKDVGASLPALLTALAKASELVEAPKP